MARTATCCILPTGGAGPSASPLAMNFEAIKFAWILFLTAALALRAADQTANPRPQIPPTATAASQDFVLLPSPTNAVQLRLYTNAAPDAAQLLNTFEIQAFGETLLAGSGTNSWRRWLKAS